MPVQPPREGEGGVRGMRKFATARLCEGNQSRRIKTEQTLAIQNFVPTGAHVMRHIVVGK